MVISGCSGSSLASVALRPQMASDTSQPIDETSSFDLSLKDRGQQNDCALMSGVAITWGVGVGHESNV